MNLFYFNFAMISDLVMSYDCFALVFDFTLGSSDFVTPIDCVNGRSPLTNPDLSPASEDLHFCRMATVIVLKSKRVHTFVRVFSTKKNGPVTIQLDEATVEHTTVTQGGQTISEGLDLTVKREIISPGVPEGDASIQIFRWRFRKSGTLVNGQPLPTVINDSTPKFPESAFLSFAENVIEGVPALKEARRGVFGFRGDAKPASYNEKLKEAQNVGLYLFFSEHGELLYIGETINLIRRIMEHRNLTSPKHNKNEAFRTAKSFYGIAGLYIVAICLDPAKLGSGNAAARRTIETDLINKYQPSCNVRDALVLPKMVDGVENEGGNLIFIFDADTHELLYVSRSYYSLIGESRFIAKTIRKTVDVDGQLYYQCTYLRSLNGLTPSLKKLWDEGQLKPKFSVFSDLQRYIDSHPMFTGVAQGTGKPFLVHDYAKGVTLVFASKIESLRYVKIQLEGPNPDGTPYPKHSLARAQLSTVLSNGDCIMYSRFGFYELTDGDLPVGNKKQSVMRGVAGILEKDPAFKYEFFVEKARNYLAPATPKQRAFCYDFEVINTGVGGSRVIVSGLESVSVMVGIAYANVKYAMQTKGTSTHMLNIPNKDSAAGVTRVKLTLMNRPVQFGVFVVQRVCHLSAALADWYADYL